MINSLHEIMIMPKVMAFFIFKDNESGRSHSMYFVKSCDMGNITAYQGILLLRHNVPTFGG